MAYITIKDEASAQFEEKKSVFIGYVKRVASEEEAREFINNIKSINKEARHNVYAYIIGENMGIQRYSDDGEPQGTGGIPVLDVIKKNNVTDAVVVVTRYFGGILLGTGGLVRAYSKAAAMAIKEGGIVEKVNACPLNLTIDYDLNGKIQYLFGKNSWHIEDIEYTDKVNIKMYCELSKIEKIKCDIIECTSGKCSIKLGKEDLYFKLENRLYKIIN